MLERACTALKNGVDFILGAPSFRGNPGAGRDDFKAADFGTLHFELKDISLKEMPQASHSEGNKSSLCARATVDP